ncbi:MAG: MaoC/PaaZ C-terminal domain-containing protein [Cupriavidus necator]
MTTNLDVGQNLPELTVEPLSRATLALYAGASGDHVPLHIDTDFARRAGMPDVFGHGMLTAAWLGRYLTSCVEQDRIRSIDLRFVGVMHLHNQAVCSGRVIEHVDVQGEPCARIDLDVKNQYGEQKVLGEAVIALSQLTENGDSE